MDRNFVRPRQRSGLAGRSGQERAAVTLSDFNGRSQVPAVSNPTAAISQADAAVVHNNERHRTIRQHLRG